MAFTLTSYPFESGSSGASFVAPSDGTTLKFVNGGIVGDANIGTVFKAKKVKFEPIVSVKEEMPIDKTKMVCQRCGLMCQLKIDKKHPEGRWFHISPKVYWAAYIGCRAASIHIGENYKYAHNEEIPKWWKAKVN